MGGANLGGHIVISVITPHWSGTTDYIERTYATLRQQTYTDWEWVVIVNNGGVLPTSIRADERVWPVRHDSDNIGALKAFGCAQARGNVLAELDADDLLTPDALGSVATAFENDVAGFVYSNSARFIDETWESPEYDSRYGWAKRPFEYEGHSLTEHVAFPATPTSLRSIWWAPNHIRAWRRSVYEAIGGHDSTLPVCDDYDLVCRTYLAGTGMYHIDQCLYLYRERDAQTSRVKNAEIQQRNRELYSKHVIPMAQEWARREGLPMIDLGGAHGKPEGYTSLDHHDADLCCDLREGIPYDDDSVGVVRAYDVLEHLPDAVAIMNEIYRVLVPGGWLLASIPSTDGRGAFQDPTHCSYWNENSLWYYTDPTKAAYVPSITARFQTARTITWYPSDWHKEHNISYVDAQLIVLKPGYWNVGECPGENSWRH